MHIKEINYVTIDISISIQALQQWCPVLFVAIWDPLSLFRKNIEMNI